MVEAYGGGGKSGKADCLASDGQIQEEGSTSILYLDTVSVFYIPNTWEVEMKKMFLFLGPL